VEGREQKEVVITFHRVSKSYPCYSSLSLGFKNFLLNLRHVVKEYRRRFVVLRDVSFKIYRGETVGILGRNGAGKSTILALMAGVIKPDSGLVEVKGQVGAFLELGAGFHPELTGRENIILNGVLLGMTRREVMNKLEQIIEFSELREFIDQPLRTFSSGMIARLGFSVVMHLEADILLVDEVLAVGDSSFQKKCWQKLCELRKKGVTILFVSHALDQIEKFCNCVIWIDNHRIRAMGKPSEVVSIYRGESEWK